MSHSAAHKQKLSRDYLAALADFQAWCESKDIPFRQGMVRAMETYRAAYVAPPADEKMTEESDAAA